MTNDTDFDPGTVIVDLGFDPDAHEIIDVPDSSDDESSDDEPSDDESSDEVAGFLCPTCRRRTKKERKITQCTDRHGVCNSCLKRYLSLKGLKVGDSEVSCFLYAWCKKKYVS